MYESKHAWPLLLCIPEGKFPRCLLKNVGMPSADMASTTPTNLSVHSHEIPKENWLWVQIQYGFEHMLSN